MYPLLISFFIPAYFWKFNILILSMEFMNIEMVSEYSCIGRLKQIQLIFNVILPTLLNYSDELPYVVVNFCTISPSQFYTLNNPIGNWSCI